MPFGWVAAATAVAGALGYMGSQNAADTQAGAANAASGTQRDMFNMSNNQAAPYRQAGYTSLNRLGYLLGTTPQTFGPSTAYNDTTTPLGRDQFDAQAYLNANPDVAANPNQNADPYSAYISEGAKVGSYRNAFRLNTTPTDGQAAGPSSQAGGYGSLMHQFDANDLNDNLAPNYAFMRDQGLGATRNAGNLQTGLISGNTLKAINDYGMNYAGNAYQQAFQNYTANQSNIYNRLASIAGLGQTANQTTANAGSSAATGIANSQLAAGQALASGQMGGANAIGGGLTNAASWYGLSNYLNRGGSYGGGTPSSAGDGMDYMA